MTKYRKLFVILALGYSPLAVVQANGQQPDSTPIRPAEELNQVIVPITKLTSLRPELKMGLNGRFSPGLEDRPAFASGFCLDEVCRFIATNYHVARVDSPKKIKGKRVIHRYLATGPTDHDATINLERDHGSVVPYAVSRDLALFELRDPVGKHHGLKYSVSEPEPGQEVEACGYPLDFNPLRNLVCVSARFRAPTTSGLLAFEFDSADHARAGMSGGIIVDKKEGRIVAVIQSANDGMVLGVSVQELMAFVSKVEPFVAAKTFPAFGNASPSAKDMYPEFEPQLDFNPEYKPEHSHVLEHRPTEPEDVATLREKAQELVEGIKNLIAVQSYSWGSGDKEPEVMAEFEVRVRDGQEQVFRRYPDGNKELSEVKPPRLGTYAMGADEWAELPTKVAKEYRLRIQRAEDAEIGGQPIKVFRYHADVEDKACPFGPIDDYVLFKVTKVVQVACYGEAWVDSDWNIVRISENLQLRDRRKEYRGWHDYRTVVTYGRIKLGEERIRSAPLTIFVEGRNGKRLYWCRTTLSNYRLFGSTHRLLAASDASDTVQPAN